MALLLLPLFLFPPSSSSSSCTPFSYTQDGEGRLTEIKDKTEGEEDEREFQRGRH